MDEPTYVALLEEARARIEAGKSLDLGAYRERAGARWAEFQELIEFDRAFGSVIEPPATRGLPRPFGDYTLVRELGRGGIGVVYEAHHRNLDRHVALKTLRPEFEGDSEFRRRYARETRSCARVRHPNLVEIYEAGEVDGVLFYAMPFLRGGSLSAAIREGRLPPPDELCRRMADVADAVGALHAEHIVHRDIKPANIVVEHDGRFVLADFGLARRVDLPALTRTGESVGTPQYMSPEQLAGDTAEIDARADVYALGATLYEALSKRRPFNGRTFPEIYHQVLTERPRPLHEVVPAVPRAVSHVVMKCLERHPGDRYATARDLAQNLRAAAAGDMVVMPSVPWVKRVGRRVRWPHAAVAALAVAAIGIGIGLGRGGSDEPGRATRGIVLTLPEGTEVDAKTLEDLAKKAREAGVPLTVSFRLASVERHAGAVHATQLVFPRGRVRVKDVTELRVDVSEAFEGPGTLVFRQGATVLAEQPFEPRDYSNLLPVPAAVRSAAKPGATIRWAYQPKRGKPVEASFEVVAADLDAELKRIEEVAAVPGQPADLGAVLRALLFIDRGLGMAAYRELAPLRAKALEDDVGYAARLQAEALLRAYGDDAGALQGADIWQRLMLRLDDLAAR